MNMTRRLPLTILALLLLATPSPARADNERLTFGVGAGTFGDETWTSVDTRGLEFLPFVLLSLGGRIGKHAVLYGSILDGYPPFRVLKYKSAILLGFRRDIAYGLYGWAEVGPWGTVLCRAGDKYCPGQFGLALGAGVGYAFRGSRMVPGPWVSVGLVLDNFAEVVFPKEPVSFSNGSSVLIAVGYDFWFWPSQDTAPRDPLPGQAAD